MKWLLLLLSLVLSISTVVLGQEKTKMKWYRDEYPNPTKDFAACSRMKASYICDPNLILSAEDADAIDDVLKDIKQATKCPCSNYADCQGDSRGYMPMVLIMAEMETDAERNDMDDYKYKKLDYLLEQAKLFGWTQMNRFNISRCGEDIMVIYSNNNHLLYTVTGKMVMNKLPGGIIGEISLNHKRYFLGDSAQMKKGFVELLSDYKDVLLGKYESYVKKGNQERPSYEAVKSNNMAAAKTASLAILGLTLVLSVMFGEL